MGHCQHENSHVKTLQHFEMWLRKSNVCRQWQKYVKSVTSQKSYFAHNYTTFIVLWNCLQCCSTQKVTFWLLLQKQSQLISEKDGKYLDKHSSFGEDNSDYPFAIWNLQLERRPNKSDEKYSHVSLYDAHKATTYISLWSTSQAYLYVYFYIQLQTTSSISSSVSSADHSSLESSSLYSDPWSYI